MRDPVGLLFNFLERASSGNNPVRFPFAVWFAKTVTEASPVGWQLGSQDIGQPLN
jgi:hypothetical protein